MKTSTPIIVVAVSLLMLTDPLLAYSCYDCNYSGYDSEINDCVLLLNRDSMLFCDSSCVSYFRKHDQGQININRGCSDLSLNITNLQADNCLENAKIFNNNYFFHENQCCYRNQESISSEIFCFCSSDYCNDVVIPLLTSTSLVYTTTVSRSGVSQTTKRPALTTTVSRSRILQTTKRPALTTTLSRSRNSQTTKRSALTTTMSRSRVSQTTKRPALTTTVSRSRISQTTKRFILSSSMSPNRSFKCSSCYFSNLTQNSGGGSECNDTGDPFAVTCFGPQYACQSESNAMYDNVTIHRKCALLPNGFSIENCLQNIPTTVGRNETFHVFKNQCCALYYNSSSKSTRINCYCYGNFCNLEVPPTPIYMPMCYLCSSSSTYLNTGCNERVNASAARTFCKSSAACYSTAITYRDGQPTSFRRGCTVFPLNHYGTDRCLENTRIFNRTYFVSGNQCCYTVSNISSTTTYCFCASDRCNEEIKGPQVSNTTTTTIRPYTTSSKSVVSTKSLLSFYVSIRGNFFHWKPMSLFASVVLSVVLNLLWTD